MTQDIFAPMQVAAQDLGAELVDLESRLDEAFSSSTIDQASLIEITVTADEQSEVSLDGTTFSSSVQFEPSGTTPLAYAHLGIPLPGPTGKPGQPTLWSADDA